MADRYWVGGTANWDGTAGTKWATTSGGLGGASVPTSADDVFFTNLSTGTCTIAAGNTGAKSINCTGFTGTLAGSAAITISGNLTLVAGMTVTYTGTITFNATSTVITAGKTLSSITINGSGITVTLGDAMTLSGTSLFTLTQGTFDTANFNLTAGRFLSSNSNTRTITLGSSTVTLTDGAQSTYIQWNTGTSTNCTLNANTSQITITPSITAFAGGGLTYYNVSYTGYSIGRSMTISGTNTFNNLSTTNSSGLKGLVFAADQTINGTLTAAGAAANQRQFLFSDAIGTTRTLTCAAVSANDCDFRDITIAGAAAPIAPTRAGNCKGNSGITFPAAKTVYWNLAGSQNWNANAWATSSNGTPAVNNFPLAQDTATFTNDGAAGTVTSTGFNLGTIDMSLRTNAMTFTFSGGASWYGDWTVGTGVTFSGGGGLTVAGRTTQTTTLNGRPAFNISVIDSPSGTLRLADAWPSGTWTLNNGTIDLNGKTLTLSRFITGTGTKNVTFNGGTIVITNATTTAWDNAAPTGFTTTAGTGTGKISMTAATAKTFVGGGSTYNCTLSNDGAGALTITGSNTFTTLANGVQPTTFTFTAGTTTTLTNWNVSGTAGNLVTIGSATAASHTLSKSSGTVSADYLSISRSTATGGATWYAGANSTNGGNNSGWLFSAAPGSYIITADGGTYSYSGNNANLIYPRTIAADGGTYSYSGNAANLIYTPVGTYTLIADGGAYSYTGNNANTLFNRTVAADGGTYAYTGNNANLLFNRVLVAEGGSYNYSGNDASLIYAPTPLIQIDTHDGDKGKKRQKRWDDEKEAREKRKRDLIDVYEQLVEGKPAVAAEIVKPYVAKPSRRTAEPTIDWNKLIADVERVNALYREYQEMDDEDVLLLL